VTFGFIGPAGTARTLPVTAGLEGGAASGGPRVQEPGPVRLEEQGGSASFSTAGDWTLVIRSAESQQA
jgi:hypothetical protein